MQTNESSSEQAQRELDEAIAALSTPEAGREVLDYLREATAKAAEEHDRVLARSWQIAHGRNIFFLPSFL